MRRITCVVLFGESAGRTGKNKLFKSDVDQLVSESIECGSA